MEDYELIEQIINDIKTKPQKSKEQVKEVMRKDRLRIEKAKLAAQFERENVHTKNPMLHMCLCNNFSGWLKTEDPDYLDQIVLLCSVKEVSIKGVLLEQLGISSKARLNREYKYRNTPKVNAGVHLFDVHVNLFLLKFFCGLKVKDAALRAAGWMDSNYPLEGHIRSTLEKRQPAFERENGKLIQDFKRLWPDGWSEEQKRLKLKEFPVPKAKALGGTRR